MTRAILRRTPDPVVGTYTTSHQQKGATYHDSFSQLGGRALLWELEQDVIRDYLDQVRPRDVVDWACGTGRITRVLADQLGAHRVTGVDVSDSMLREARSHAAGAHFIRLGGEPVGDHLAPSSIDLVTAFRFFPNAETELRDRAAGDIDRLLRPGGHVIVNNHRNFWSPSYVVRRTRPGSEAPGATNTQVIGPFRARGYEVEGRRSLGIWPQSDRRAYGLPWPAVRRLERVNARTTARWHSVGADTVWLLRKPASRPAPG